MADATSWQRLCVLLDDDEHLWPAVEDALESGADAWDALLSALDDAGALASLETSDTGMELAEALVRLPRIFRLQPDLGRVNDTDDLDEAVASADELLVAAGYRLLRLDEPGTDDLAFVVVAAGSADDIVALADEVGGGASLPD